MANILGTIGRGIGRGLRSVGNRMSENRARSPFWQKWGRDKGPSNAVLDAQIDEPARPSVFRKGGMVKKTGMAKVHKGEKVLTKNQQKRMSKSCR